MKYSIITVAYNNLAGLKLTAESVLAQTSRDYEWLIFDGGSSDGTKEYLESLGDKVSYWESMRDGGIYDAMNKGVRKASGEYLIFMNSGDRFASADVLEKVAAYAHDAEVVYGDWVEVAGETRTTKQGPKTVDFVYFCERNICHQAMFIKAELLKKSEYSTTIGAMADWAKWLEFTADGVDFEHLPIVVCDYDKTGISSKFEGIEELVKMMASLELSLRARIIATLLTRSIRFASLSQFLGLGENKRLPWLARKKYKILAGFYKDLKRFCEE